MWLILFQHTAARRRLGVPTLYSCLNDRFQHTAARRRLAAGGGGSAGGSGFNTQPPEGGWAI